MNREHNLDRTVMKAIQHLVKVNDGFTSLRDVKKYLIAEDQITSEGSKDVNKIIKRLFKIKKIKRQHPLTYMITAKFSLNHNDHRSRSPAEPKNDNSMTPSRGKKHDPLHTKSNKKQPKRLFVSDDSDESSTMETDSE